MGFLDKAKAAATELAAKADTALANSGMGGPGGPGASPDRLLRDLGVLIYLETTGRPAPAGERERVLAALREAEQRGPVNLSLQTVVGAPGSAPPPPGAAAGMHQAAPPPSPGTGTPPGPPPGGGAPLTVDGPATAPVSPPPPPPPPPSWA